MNYVIFIVLHIEKPNKNKNIDICQFGKVTQIRLMHHLKKNYQYLVKYQKNWNKLIAPLNKV